MRRSSLVDQKKQFFSLWDLIYWLHACILLLPLVRWNRGKPVNIRTRDALHAQLDEMELDIVGRGAITHEYDIYHSRDWTKKEGNKHSGHFIETP